MPTAGNPNNHSLVLAPKEILRRFIKLIKQSLKAGKEKKRFVIYFEQFKTILDLHNKKNVLSTFCSLPSVSVNDD